MIPAWSEEAEAVFRRAAKERLVAPGACATVLDRRAIERILPHRDPFLLVHRVTHVDLAGALLEARYDLPSAGAVFDGHFPGNPLYPGVLQIEMIGQAGLLLRLLRDGVETSRARKMVMTHVLGARFSRPVGATGELVVAVRGVDDDDGLFATGVGQCIYDGAVCSVAAVACVIEEAAA